MRPMTIAALKVGLIPPEFIQQAELWGVVQPDAPDLPEVIPNLTPQQIQQVLEHARDDLGDVEFRETELDLDQRFAEGAEQVKLRTPEGTVKALAVRLDGARFAIPYAEKLDRIRDDVLFDVEGWVIEASDGAFSIQSCRASYTNNKTTYLVVVTK